MTSTTKGLSSHVSGERACNSHSTYVDSEILDVTINSTNIQRTSYYRHIYMSTYRHTMPLLAAPRALKASLIIGTSDNEITVEWIRVSGSDKYLAN